MSDTNEPKEIDTILHYTRAHSPDEWRWPKYSNSLNELSEDDRLLIEYAPRLRAEVIRLREEVRKVEQKRDKYLGALDSAIEQIGYTGMGIDYEERMREDEGITVYGDEYLRCDCEGCSGLVKDKYDDYIIKGIGNQESVRCDFDECPYYYGDEEE